MWHADKSLPQTQLINKLSTLLTNIDSFSLSVDYFAVFLITMRREWSGIDGLRLDKFYLLIRRFVNNLFCLMKKYKWDLEVVERLMRVLVEKGFLADDGFLGNGVNYHVVSVFVEELRGFLPLRKDVVEVIFGGFVGITGKVSDKVLLGKIKSNVFDGLLEMGRKLLEVRRLGGEVGENDDVVVLGSIALAMGFSAKFYESGSSVECIQGNRKLVLRLHEEFLKLEKDLAASDIEVLLPESNGGDDDDVPDLVPIGTGMEVDVLNGDVASGGSGSKNLKKSKKASKAKKNKKNFISGNGAMVDDNVSVGLLNGENSNEEKSGDDDNVIMFTETAIVNLQKQFEKVAEEVDMDKDVASACDITKVNGNGTVSKKRKRAKSVDRKRSGKPELTSQGDAEDGATAKSGDKSAKKVRFSMKNNLVWKPHSPLPPQDLRLPPSVTPRGSALKAGLPPGPIKEMPPAKKKVKQRAKTMKKGQKGIKGISPATKRVKKLKSISI